MAKEKQKDVVRLDLMFTQAIEYDMIVEFDKYGVGQKYTKTSNIVGKGEHDPKMGDPIWPQLNSSFTIFCSPDEALIIKRIVEDMRLRFPMEGIACFKSVAEEW